MNLEKVIEVIVKVLKNYTGIVEDNKLEDIFIPEDLITIARKVVLEIPRYVDHSIFEVKARITSQLESEELPFMLKLKVAELYRVYLTGNGKYKELHMTLIFWLLLDYSHSFPEEVITNKLEEAKDAILSYSIPDITALLAEVKGSEIKGKTKELLHGFIRLTEDGDWIPTSVTEDKYKNYLIK